MNPEKLSKLQAQVRIGGKGTARRKKKIIHRTATTDDKKLQSSLKKLSVNTIPGIEEVNMIKDDGTVIHFNNPKVQASLSANTFAISGQNETKQIADMLPGIWNQLGADSLTHLRRLASNVPAVGNKKGGVTESSGTTGIDDEDEEVPNLIENFDEPSKDEGIVNKKDEAIIINKKDEVKEIKKEEKKEVKKEAAKEEKKEVKDEKVEEKDQ